MTNNTTNGALNSKRWHVSRAERDDLPFEPTDDLFVPIPCQGRATAEQSAARALRRQQSPANGPTGPGRDHEDTLPPAA
jgi:hypothetical protein